MPYYESSESYDAVLRILEVGILLCYVRNLSQSLGFILRHAIHHMSPRNPRPPRPPPSPVPRLPRKA